MPAASAPGPPPMRREYHRNWVEAISSVARVAPGGAVRRVGEVTVVRSGLGVTAFNCVFALEPPRALDGVAEEVEFQLGSGENPWCLITSAESTAGFEPLLRDLRLRRYEVLPGMVWDPLPVAALPPPAGLEIRRIENRRELRTFGRAMMEGFGARVDLMDPWADAAVAKDWSAGPSSGYYLGWSEGRPVATAVRYSTGAVAGIYGVSTVPDFRRRGWGAAITHRAAVDGGAEGCRVSFLQSSEMGRSVYERLGYRTMEEYVLWARQTDARPGGRG